MARSMSSRFLFSAGCSFTDLENPPDPPNKNTHLLIPFTLPPLPFPKFSMSRSLLLSLILTFLCYRTCSLHCTMLSLPLIIHFIVYFLFKNRSRLIPPWFFKKKPPRFFIGDEDTSTKKSRRLICGPGVESSSDGTVYAGEFYKGSRTGRGVIRIPGRCTYKGDWIDGAYEGYGVERLAGCGQYKGKFWKGVRHGFGSMWFYNGERYSGEWRYGEKDGMGEQICAGGISYFGEFKKGMKHGLGICRFRKGDIYLGEHFGNKFLGFGVCQFWNGDCYEGSWHDDRMAGYGVYTMRDGEILSGIWVDGALVTRLPPVFPCIQESIKAATKAAQRSRDLRRVEYDVFHAVYAACNAAKAARLVSMAICKEKGLRLFDPRRLVSWIRKMYVDRLNGESQVEGAKKTIRELSYCLQSSAACIRTAFLDLRRLSGRCRLLLTELDEEYLVSRLASRSTAGTCSFALSPKKSK